MSTCTFLGRHLDRDIAAINLETGELCLGPPEVWHMVETDHDVSPVQSLGSVGLLPEKVHGKRRAETLAAGLLKVCAQCLVADALEHQQAVFGPEMSHSILKGRVLSSVCCHCSNKISVKPSKLSRVAYMSDAALFLLMMLLLL